MDHDLIETATALIKGQKFAEAILLLRTEIDQDPVQWNAWYLTGQCLRYLNDYEGAIRHLARAAEFKSDEPSIHLALGIAFQLSTQWDRSVDAFRRAIEIDPLYVLAYNSLALTQKKRGELDKALHNYHAGAKALARGIVTTMQNVSTNRILKHRKTEASLWIEYAVEGAVFLTASSVNIASMAWLDGEQALEEERTEKHVGLYWVDIPNDNGEAVRVFLPNYFNTFQMLLRRDAIYSNLVGNRGTVLELLDRHDEARRHFEEATEFHP